jgi:RNA 3'-terminal phosphate cyclase
MAPVQRCSGAQSLRYRLVLAHVSGRTLRCVCWLACGSVSSPAGASPDSAPFCRVDDVRVDDSSPGLVDYEASLLRLLEKVTNGTVVEINETGTRARLEGGSARAPLLV